MVAYARPFTNNSSGVEVNATPQLSVRLSKLFSQQEQQLHDELLALRNEVVAHTEYKRKPVKRIQGSATGFSMTVKIFDIVSVPLDMYLWSGMCGALRGHCFQAMMELNSKIVDLNP